MMKQKVTTNEWGEIQYKKNGKFHRDDGPAFIGNDGILEWYNKGLLHRTDGPAVIEPNGLQLWYILGNEHRIDGPSTTWEDGSVEWFVHDIRYHSNKSYQEAAGLTDEEMIMIILKYGNVS